MHLKCAFIINKIEKEKIEFELFAMFLVRANIESSSIFLKCAWVVLMELI